ncbi:MAG: putative ABC exporter domain-containing protein [Vicinamibacterales bacterium]
MNSPFLYLVACSARNAVRVWLQRLRQPRYLIGLAAGAFYFYFFLFGNRRGRRGRPGLNELGFLAGQYHGTVEVVVGSLLLVGAVVACLLPGSVAGVFGFSPADQQFLFPAPLTRRSLFHYKLVRSLAKPALSSAFITLLMRPSSVTSMLLTFTGILVTTLTISFFLAGVAVHAATSRHRGQLAQWSLVAAFACAAAVVVGTVARGWPNLIAAGSPRDLALELQHIGETGSAKFVLLPFVALVRLPIAAAAGGFARALPAPLLMLTAAYLWVVRADVPLEEASATPEAVEATRASERTSGQAVVRKSPFALAVTGPAETALLWKNVIAFSRHASPKVALRLLPLLIIGGVTMSKASKNGNAVGLIATLCLGAAGMVVLFGPQMVRNDLRQDLAHLAVLKSWPLRGAVIVRGQVLAPALLLSGIAWMAIATALSMSGSLRFATMMPLTDRLSFAAAALLLAPGLILTQLIVHNAIALMFPAWVSVSRSRGIDMAGQRMVLLGGLMVALVVTCIPAALAAGLAGMAIHAVTGGVPVVVPALVALIVLALECGIATEALGTLFDRTDIGALRA